jgi:peptide/nickel transport system permease protein
MEILPNMTSLVVSGFIGAVVYAIGAQVGLEFLGLGDVSEVTWGTNLYWASNQMALLTESWWTFVPTGLSVALVGFGLVMINFAIDEVTNPRLRNEGAFLSMVLGAGLTPGFSTPVMQLREPEEEGGPAPDPQSIHPEAGGEEDTDYSDPSMEEDTKP